jgi:SAM-dependent methyltransferase
MDQPGQIAAATRPAGDAAVPLAFDGSRPHRLISALVDRCLGGRVPPPLSIHARDHMFRFLVGHHQGNREAALVDYFRSGWSVRKVVHQLLNWRFGADFTGVRMLDFAAGFGRVTRFLLCDLRPERLWVADVFPEAVEFQRNLLGVNGLVSTPDADEFHCAAGFDCVLACSFFSHAPRDGFVPWLRRLARTVAPGGVLLVSVHDEALLPQGIQLEGGVCFQQVSEIPELPVAQYGSSWVNESFMAEVIDRGTGGRGSYLRLPRALWSYQDLYVIAPSGDLPARSLAFRTEPLGYLDGCKLSADGQLLALRGWAVDHGGPGIEAIRVAIDGAEVGRCSPSGEREDAARFLRRQHLGPVGWEVELRGPSGPWDAEALLTVQAVSCSGAEFLIHLGRIDSTELATRARAAEAQLMRTEAMAEHLRAERNSLARRLAAGEETIRALTERTAAMQASRFWRLRNAWWSLKRALGVAREPDWLGARCGGQAAGKAGCPDAADGNHATASPRGPSRGPAGSSHECRITSQASDRPG